MSRFSLAVLACCIAFSNAIPTPVQESALVQEQLTWGRDGHSITGLVAQKFLDPTATDALNTILADYDGQLSHIVNWADEVKGTPLYSWSKPLHYINTPDWACNFQHSRDCGDDICAAGAISNYTTIFNSTSGQNQQIALKFLTHFIGDIHQPLHVGFTSDKGGNSITVHFEGKTENLHGVWDFGIIDNIVSRNFSNYGDYANYVVSQVNSGAFPDMKSWTKCQDNDFPCPDEWAQETAEIACQYAYVNADGKTPIKNQDTLDDKYFLRVEDIVTKQLARSGVRMAAVINAVVGSGRLGRQ